MKRILILEDNVVVAEHIASLINELEIKSKIFLCDNIKDAYQYTLEKDIDLFITDIILDASSPGDSSGLKFIDSIRKIEQYAFIPVIFVTSLEDSKLYSYEKLHCFSFVEKPFDEKQLKALVRQCLNFPITEKQRKTLYFRRDGIILAVDREDIVYAECRNHMLHIHTQKGDLLSVPYVTLKKFLEEADSDEMLQCSRSIVVNKQFIHNIDVPNRVIQLKNHMGSVGIGVMYKKHIREIFR